MKQALWQSIVSLGAFGWLGAWGDTHQRTVKAHTSGASLTTATAMEPSKQWQVACNALAATLITGPESTSPL